MAAFGLTVGAALAASGFVDVADSHRASAEITAAHQVGVFQGYGDGTFRPDDKLTRGQAELIIHRMLTWQGTDDDGNFEISRADAAVLAMSGLCGLDLDRIPACAAVAAASEAEVQAAYDRGYDNGFDDGLDAATPTGSTPPPVTNPPTVTNPPAPATAAQKCNDQGAFYREVSNLWRTWREPGLLSGRYDSFGVYPHQETVEGDGGWNGAWHRNGERSYNWTQKYANEFPNGLACSVYGISVFEHKDGRRDLVWDEAYFSFETICWTPVFTISGQPHRRRHHMLRREQLSHEEATPTLLAAIAGDRPGPVGRWSSWDRAEYVHSSHTDCLRQAEHEYNGVLEGPLAIRPTTS